MLNQCIVPSILTAININYNGYTIPTPSNSLTPLRRKHTPNLRILLLNLPQLLPRQPHRAIQRNRQSPMSPPQHDQDHNDLAARVHPPAETVRLVRQPDADANGRVAADNLEKDREDAVCARVFDGVVRFDKGDEEEGEGDPPYVVGELAADLLADEGWRVGRWVCGERVDGGGAVEVHGH